MPHSARTPKRKPITPRLHGVLDYSTVAACVALPRLVGVHRNARLLFDSLAAGYGALSMATRYPLGVKPVVSFRAHGATEIAIGAVLPAAPFLLGFAHDRTARNLCLALTGITAVVAALTDWNSEEAP